MKWRVELLTDKETGPMVVEAYQKRVAQILTRVRPELEALVLSADLEQLHTATVRAIVKAASAIGRKKIVPGRTKPWWSPALDTAIASRRQLRDTWLRQRTGPALCNWKQALKLTRSTQRRCKLEYLKQQGAKLNEVYHQKVSERSTNGEKRFWRTAKTMPGMGTGKATTPVMMRDPVLGMLQCTHQGVLAAQVHHTQQLGSQHQFAQANPQFDDQFLAHVTEAVASFATTGAAAPGDHAAAADVLNDPIAEDEVLEALTDLNNGKAASPHTGVPNELLKYGGSSMARLLMPLFTAVWRTAALPQAWTKGVIQYFFKSGDPASMGNYRGITLLDVVSKLFHKVLANRLVQHVENHGLLNTAQNAFRPGRSTDDHVYCISEVVKGRQRGGLPTYAFFLDVSKAYDTVWRDGLLYKLWHKGIRGTMWQYVRAMYTCTSRSVKCGAATSAEVHIDLGTAQGDTLSCILFDLFIDDLADAVEAECPGVPLPVPGDADALLARRLAALLFADDFNALAESPGSLQRAVDVTHAWCCKWRMKANVGPTKSAVMLFAPDCAQQPLQAGDVLWGGEPLPVVDKYKYLGVMLASDCTWQAHIQHVVAKATKASYAMGSVLHNRRLDTEIRRIVLMAKLRPVVEYGSTVWHVASAQERNQIEAVMIRVMKRFLAVFENVHHDVLRMEWGCRSFNSWMTQRVLEYGFRLRRMSVDRLPAAVHASVWGRVPGARRPRMCAEELQRAVQRTALDVAQSAADEVTSYGHFKRIASEAVRVADLRDIVHGDRRTRQSTLHKYLQLVGPIPAGSMFPNECRPYLTGIMSQGAQLKFLLRSGMLPVGRRESQKRRRGAVACAACGGPEEDAVHFVFTCGALHAARDKLHAELDSVTSGAFGQLQYDEPLDQVLLSLLGDSYWGAAAGAVDSCVRSFLVAAWAAREAAVAARALDAEPELLVEPEPEPAVACVRVRACQRVRGAVAAEHESGVRICAECHSRRRAADMLQCPGCVRWFHRACGGVRSVPVPLDWCCGACAVAVHSSPDGSPTHTHRRQRREGPWRSR
jgi:hypothetical protein